MSIRTKVASMVGLAGNRDGAAPIYRLIAPGLAVTDEGAWAWYVIRTTNSDLLGEEGRDVEQDKADIALRALLGRECHLRGMWGSISGDAYRDGLDLDRVDDDGNLLIPEASDDGQDLHPVRRWAEERAADLDFIQLPSKTRLLGVKLRERNAGARGRAGAAFGLADRRVPEDEQRQLRAAVRQLGDTLSETLWRVRLASTETIAWSIARELHRDTPLPEPLHDKIEGAPLHRLCSGHVIPMTDHLLFCDSTGEITAYGAVLGLVDFPEELVTPGQEWLAVLNGMETGALGNEGLEPVQVLAEESVRFTVPKSREALRTVDDARRSAKEQRRSAEQASAGEADDSITLAEAEARETALALKRRRTMLVHDHPRIVVSAHTKAELDAKIAAVEAAYDEMGITACVLPDEQRELWLETLPCDHVRVPDLGHWREVGALSASWFWGGAAVGSTAPTIPAIGYTTGSTQNLVRFLATESVENSDAPVTVLTGRTRRGKTTSLQLALLDVCLSPDNVGRQPWATLIDSKGDAGGTENACREYGVPCHSLRIDERATAMRGQLDGFLTADPEQTLQTVNDQLKLLVPAGQLLEAAGHFIPIATKTVASGSEPRSWKVIEELSRMAEEDGASRDLRTLASVLDAVTDAGWGALVAGKPPEGSSRTRMPTETGITLLVVPGLFQGLPEADTAREQWDDRQRAAVAVLRGLLAWCTSVAASPELRSRPKVVAVPEVHLLTATQDGRAFLTQQARMGAAAGLSMLLDTQDVSGIAQMTGLSESISAIFGFSQYTEAEQQALARFVRLPETPETYEVIEGLDTPTSVDETDADEVDAVRRGHCIYRDRRGNTATIQWRLPSQEAVDLLNTSAAAQAARRENEQRRDAERAQRDEEAAHV